MLAPDDAERAAYLRSLFERIYLRDIVERYSLSDDGRAPTAGEAPFGRTTAGRRSGGAEPANEGDLPTAVWADVPSQSGTMIPVLRR